MLPIAVATVLIPEVAARQARGAPTVGLLRQALVLVGASCGLVMALCYVSPSFVAALTFGDGYPGAEVYRGSRPGHAGAGAGQRDLATGSPWARRWWPGGASPLRRCRRW